MLTADEIKIVNVFEQSLRADGGDPAASSNPTVVLNGSQLSQKLPHRTQMQLAVDLASLVKRGILVEIAKGPPLPSFVDREWKLEPLAYEYMSRV